MLMRGQSPRFHPQRQKLSEYPAQRGVHRAHLPPAQAHSYADPVTGGTDAADLPERSPENVSSDASGSSSPTTPAEASKAPERRQGVLRKVLIVVVILVVLYFVVVMFVARLYTIPSEAMEPTIHGCGGCVDDHVIVDKLSYRFGSPQPGDVILFEGPSVWNPGDQDQTDFVKRVIAVGGQTVQCRVNTGLTVNGTRLTEPYLDPATMNADPSVYPCLGPEFGPVHVPPGRLWVMGGQPHPLGGLPGPLHQHPRRRNQWIALHRRSHGGHRAGGQCHR